jgi:hypothetical protein
MSYVFESLLATPGCEPVRREHLDEFVAAGPRVLFLTGDTIQRPEAGDVAVVMREIMRGPEGERVRLGVVDRRDEEPVMKKFGVVVLPAVVMIRDGQVKEIVARMRDWQVYTQAFARLAAAGLLFGAF